MIDKFLFIEDLKGENGKIARANAFETLEELLDDEFEIECNFCDERCEEIEDLEKDIDDLSKRVKQLEIENKMLKKGFTVVK